MKVSKRTWLLVFSAVICVGVAGSLMGSGSAALNGVGDAGAEGVAAVDCFVADSAGNPTNVVVALHPGDLSYWMRYNSGGELAMKVRFLAIPLYSNSAVTAIITTLAFPQPGTSTNIETPFGVPYWGSDLTSGPWVLLVLNDNGSTAAYPFDVVPI